MELSATDSSNRRCINCNSGFNLNLGNTKKDGWKDADNWQIKRWKWKKLDENNDLLKNEINNIKSDMQDMKVEKIKEKLYVVDQFINDKYINCNKRTNEKNIQTE